MDWNNLLTVLAVVLTNITTILTLYIHLDNKTDRTIESMRMEIREFQKESMDERRDFHSRLISIEERIRK